MKYYKGLKEAHDYFTGWTLIKNELVTEKERNTKFRYLLDSCFAEVQIPKTHTYKSFGVRFEMNE